MPRLMTQTRKYEKIYYWQVIIYFWRISGEYLKTSQAGTKDYLRGHRKQTIFGFLKGWGICKELHARTEFCMAHISY